MAKWRRGRYNTEEQTKPQRNRPKSDDGRSTVENTEEGVSSWTNEKERQLCQLWREEMHLYQWRAEGLQRPGANACIGAPPPPELAFPPGGKIERKKKVFGKNKKRKTPLMHRERGAHSIYATFARLKFAPTFKIRPYKLARRPLQGLRPGAMAPLPPPPSVRH